LEQVLKEGKAVEIVNQGLQVLLHDDLADTHSQLHLHDRFGENELEIAYTEFLEVFMLDCKLIH
jgi:hypothetical protein